MRLAGGLSFVLHVVIFSLVALMPAHPDPPANDVVLSALVEVEAPEPEPEPEVEGLAEDEGGNGIPLAAPEEPAPVEPQAAPEPAEEEPEPESAPEPVHPEAEEIVASDEPATEDEAPTAQEAADEGEPTDKEPEASGAAGDGPPGGRGEGFGSGSGGGEPPPPVDFFRTFLKSLPSAGKNDPDWASLERGAAGRVTFRVTLRDGRLEPIQIVAQPGAPAPPYLRRIVLKNRELLRNKLLLLHPGLANATRLFVLDASIDRRSPDSHTPGLPGVSKLGLLGIPMKNGAYFTYYSGHHVNLLMYRQAEPQ